VLAARAVAPQDIRAAVGVEVRPLQFAGGEPNDGNLFTAAGRAGDDDLSVRLQAESRGNAIAGRWRRQGEAAVAESRVEVSAGVEARDRELKLAGADCLACYEDFSSCNGLYRVHVLIGS